ncbi:ferric-chelate reductase Frp1 [Elasticomyces elasticus]|uniref:Ferric-chelate reductase Frp1 n=1 Tax=Elasticomyces elasticus TaxID=574655 RepID=A0AAN7WMX4_9PEZI|nr:ferric-chelate reductase Frp1 [Elasticomyces elasticus]
MDMDMGGDSMGGSSGGPLSPDGVDFSDPDQASDFLEALLNDDELKVIGNAYARYFWYGVVVVVAIAAIYHWTRKVMLYMRLRAAARGAETPARPKSVLAKWFATVTAIAREVTYFDLTPYRLPSSVRWFKIPPVGTIVLLITYLAFVLALEFINDSVPGAQFWQARGIRAGWLAVAQVPLTILLVGRNNLFTLTTGVSYERLNVLHRWSARVMLLMAIFHFSFQSKAWSDYGLMKLEWSTDSCPPTGIAAFALLLWMNLSTLAPFRFWLYEFFVWQHLITFAGFIIAVAYHLPSTATWSRIYIYIPSALYIIDRLLRWTWLVWSNKNLSRATLTRLDGEATKVVLRNTTIKAWRAGSWVHLSLPGLGAFGWAQTHPATIMSTPTSHGGDMVFLLKGHKGFTKRIMESADSSIDALLPARDAEKGQEQRQTKYAIINGPYGGHHQDFAAFDSVCLIAGSTGITFTLAILQNLAERAANCGKRLPVRKVKFVWCVKQHDRAKWVNNELVAAVEKLSRAGIETSVLIYATCDESLTESNAEVKLCGCNCDKSQGPCCCTAPGDDDTASEEGSTKAVAQAASPTQISEKDPDSAIISVSRKEIVVKRPWLPCADFCSGRPMLRQTLTELLDGADGESGVAVCGPIGMGAEVRRAVVGLSDERAIHKGSGAQGCYLHVESFS